MNYRRILLSFGVIWGMCAPVAVALASDTLTVEPSIVRLTMRPGEVWRGQVVVVNDSDSPINLAQSTASLLRAGEGGALELNEGITARIGTIASWLATSDGLISFQPRQRVPVDFAIQVPQNASPGSHKGVLIFSRAAMSPRTNAISTIAAVAVGVDLTIIGQPNHLMRLQSVSVDSWIHTKPPVSVSAMMMNSGNTMPVVTMRAEVGRVWGRTASFALAPEGDSRLVAPGTSATFRGRWDGVGTVPFGIFRTRIIAQDSLKEYEAIRYFILVPWQVIVGLCVALGIVILGRRVVIRIYRYSRG